MKPVSFFVGMSLALGGLVAMALLAGCSSHQPEPPPPASKHTPATTTTTTAPTPAGRNWSLVMLQGAPVPAAAADRRHPSLQFDAAAGRVTGYAGVNQFGGPYTMEGQSLTFGNLVMTRMAGPASDMALEQKYVDALKATTGWRMTGGKLELLAGERVIARFQ